MSEHGGDWHLYSPSQDKNSGRSGHIPKPYTGPIKKRRDTKPREVVRPSYQTQTTVRAMPQRPDSVQEMYIRYGDQLFPQWHAEHSGLAGEEERKFSDELRELVGLMREHNEPLDVRARFVKEFNAYLSEVQDYVREAFPRSQQKNILEGFSDLSVIVSGLLTEVESFALNNHTSKTARIKNVRHEAVFQDMQITGLIAGMNEEGLKKHIHDRLLLKTEAEVHGAIDLLGHPHAIAKLSEPNLFNLFDLALHVAPTKAVDVLDKKAPQILMKLGSGQEGAHLYIRPEARHLEARFDAVTRGKPGMPSGGFMQITAG